MNGLCRELMAELLAAGAAAAKDYDPESEERNAGNHGKRIVTLFGEIPEIKRTYYWNEDTRSGHYPFDERLGLVGRYTPAAANEMVRYAVGHPYKDAAAGFSRNHAFKVSADTVREVVGLYRDRSSAFVKDKSANEGCEADDEAKVVCVMADGTGMPMRKECLQGAKGKDGRAKTREVKAEAIFIASKTSDNEPHRDLDTTTYVATTHRREKFGKYLRGNAGRMKYDEYRANGWFIGSGVIESGCKTVIGQRFKQSGMIWSLKGAKALLPLRTLYKSNRLEEFFGHLVKDLPQVECAA